MKSRAYDCLIKHIEYERQIDAWGQQIINEMYREWKERKMKNSHDVKHWLQSKKLWAWFLGVLMFHGIAVLMIIYGMEIGATITEGIAGCLSLGYILGQASVDRALTGAAEIARALRGKGTEDQPDD